MENIDQTNYEEDYSANKIRTPASLFSKSSYKSPVNALRIRPSPSNSQLRYACENHPQKQAAFTTVTDYQQLYFCQKCAITLASQGHAITKIHSDSRRITSPNNSSSSKPASALKHSRWQPKSKRQLQMQSFLCQLRQLRTTIESSKQTIKQKLIESQQFYGQQLEQINEYFSLIIRSLQLQKHKCYNHILKQRQQAEHNIRNIDQQLQHIDQDITRILMDIEDNLDTVFSIEEDMYQLVINQYKTQQDQFQKTLAELLLAPIEMRKIQFQGVPESIYNLSDQVIQNSLKNQDHQQYRLVDSLSPEELANLQAITPREQNRDSTPIRQISQAESLRFSFQAQKLKVISQSSQQCDRKQ